MRKNLVILFTALFFTFLMLIKGAGALLPSFIVSAQSLFTTELADLEKEKESKSNSLTVAQSAEELFDHSISSFLGLDNACTSVALRERNVGVLPDGYLDTLTPPPNRS